MERHNHRAPVLSRRTLLKSTAVISFGWSAGSVWQGGSAMADPTSLNPNPWVAIAADGTITIMSPAVEMGQGSTTALPLILAEELDADWAKVRIKAAPPNDAVYGNPRFGRIMYTAGSNAVSGYYDALRLVGAQARQVLLTHAARHWGVAVDDLITEPSTVVHPPSSRRLRYGEIAALSDGLAPASPASASEVETSDSISADWDRRASDRPAEQSRWLGSVQHRCATPWYAIWRHPAGTGGGRPAR
jgi:isoquinoline 1-oxidoreductase beta subunit